MRQWCWQCGKYRQLHPNLFWHPTMFTDLQRISAVQRLHIWLSTSLRIFNFKAFLVYIFFLWICAVNVLLRSNHVLVSRSCYVDRSESVLRTQKHLLRCEPVGLRGPSDTVNLPKAAHRILHDKIKLWAVRRSNLIAKITCNNGQSVSDERAWSQRWQMFSLPVHH